MVFAWLGSGGAIQMAGYTVDTWFGYMGWGIADYFVYLQDRFTFAQSVFLNNQALLFDLSHDTPNVDPIGLNYDKDVFVLYGDPAYRATLQKVTEPLYDQFLAFTNVDGVVAYSLTIHMNSAVNIARPIIAYLPIKIREPRIIQHSGRLVDVVDDMVLVQVWRFGEHDLQKNQEWHIAFSGIANSKPENHTADFLEPRWIIDGTEVNRVLAYWRAGAYRRETTGADGYAPSLGSTDGLRHSADYQTPYWLIDGAEVSRVLAYWRAGAYHVNPDGVDGFAPGQ